MTKKEREALVDGLWEYACAVLPVFGDTLLDAWHKEEWMFEPTRLSGRAKDRLMRVLKNPEHPDRLILSMDAYFSKSVAPDEERFINNYKAKRRFKAHIRMLLGVEKVVSK